MIHSTDHSAVVEDDISILSSPYVPEVEMVQAIKSRVQSREEEIHDLDMKIQELCAQRDALRRTNAVAHALLAPIRKLLPEILAEIFILCIPMACDYDLEHPILCLVDPVYMCQHLGEVCHRWRDILDDTPQAWTFLNFSSPLPDISVIRRFLQNSKSCPLDIYFKPRHTSREISPHSFQAYLRTLMQLLRGEVDRFRMFFADMTNTGQPGLLGELFPCGESSNAPIMGTFVVRTKDYDGSMGDVMSPKLQSLDVWGASYPLRSFSASSISSLRRLHLSLQTQSPGAISFLEHCPQLEELHCSGAPGLFLWTTRQEIRISLPSFKALSLSLHVDEAKDLMKSLHVPLLDTIHFDMPEDWVLPPISDLLDCLAPVPVLLRHLTLKNVSLTGDDRQWLSRFDNIRFLEIGGNSSLDKTIVSSLIPLPFTPLNTWVCPKLEELILREITIPVPGDELVRLMYSRTQPDSEEPLPGYLSRLKVFRCAGLKPIHIEELSRTNRKSLRFTDHPNNAWRARRRRRRWITLESAVEN